MFLINYIIIKLYRHTFTQSKQSKQCLHISISYKYSIIKLDKIKNCKLRSIY